MKNYINSSNEQRSYFNLRDRTWMEVYINEENFTYLEDLRNISGSVSILNGNYSSNQGSGIQFTGIYRPQLLRGYGVFQYGGMSIFNPYQYEQNDTVDELIEEAEWPPIIDTQITQDDINNYQDDGSCYGQVYFQLQLEETERPVTTMKDIYYRRVNDTFYENNTYYQYKLNYTAISHQCGFIIQSNTMEIYQDNAQINQSAYFFSIYLVLSLISCILQIVYIFKNNILFVQDFPLIVLVLWSNASYLYIVGLIIYSIQVSYTVSQTILCVMLQAISLISPTLKIALKGVQNRDEASQCARICIMIVYTLMGLVLGFVVIILALLFNVIYVIFPICCILMCYIPLYSMIILFDRTTWQKPLFPGYFLIGECGIKLLFMFYVCCFTDNFGNCETNIYCLIALGPLGVFYIIYLFQLKLGSKFGYVPKKALEQTYDYSGHLLPESEIAQFKQSSQQKGGLKLPFAPLVWNQCKYCQNMTHIHQNNLNKSLQQTQSQTQCFAYVDIDSYQILCPICLSQIDIDLYLQSLDTSILGESEYVLKSTKNQQKQRLIQDKREKIQDESLYVTPCNHCFHKYCLETWLQQHRQCPSCRTQLLLPKTE